MGPFQLGCEGFGFAQPGRGVRVRERPTQAGIDSFPVPLGEMIGDVAALVKGQ